MSWQEIYTEIVNTPTYLGFAGGILGLIVLAIILVIVALYRNRPAYKKQEPQAPLPLAAPEVIEQKDSSDKALQPDQEFTPFSSTVSQSSLSIVAAPDTEPGVLQTKLKLKHESETLQENFDEFRRRALAESDDIVSEILPYFLMQDGKFEREIIRAPYLETPEKILQYWADGKREGKLGFLMAVYLCARNHENLNLKLREILTLKSLADGDRALINFYFQNELGMNQVPPPANLPPREAMAAFSISVRILNSQTEGFNRNKIQKLNLSAPRPLSPFFDAVFYAHGNKFVRSLQQSGNNYADDKANFVFRNWLQSGNKKRYKELLEFPEYSEMFEKWRNDPDSIADEYIGMAPPGCFKLLLEDFEYQPNENTPEKFVIKPADYREWLWENGPSLPAHYTMRWIKYFISNSLWKELLACTNNRSRHSEYLIRFYRARALFHTGFLHEAWNTIFELWTDYPDNLPVMNEAAIYAGKTGRWQQAEEIFTQLKTIYPGHPGIAYNEALLFEHKAETEIRKKWSEVDKLKKKVSA